MMLSGRHACLSCACLQSQPEYVTLRLALYEMLGTVNDQPRRE